VILAITLFLLYIAGAWVLLRSVDKPRLEPLAWLLILLAIVGHSDAIMRMMRINGAFSIGVLEQLPCSPGHWRCWHAWFPSTGRTALSAPS
jgi:hypothetical protein